MSSDKDESKPLPTGHDGKHESTPTGDPSEPSLLRALGIGLDVIETDDLTASFRYETGRTLGKGGLGVVLSVYDRKLRRRVALKKLRRAFPDEETLARFLLEAQVTGQLAHPNIMPVYDVGLDPEGQAFFTMKEIRGRSLSELLREGQAGGLVERLLIFRQVCNAIAFAHSRRVFHRDIKPSNVMVGEFGEVLVVDWGLAKVLGSSESTGSTVELDAVVSDAAHSRVGAVSGTPTYMSPEQAQGKSDQADERSDVYALGGLLYTLLAGRAAFKGNALEVIQQVRVGDWKLPSTHAPGAVPRELDAVVARAMALDPANRYPSAGALSEDIQAFLEGQTVSAARYTAFQRLQKWAGRHRRVVAAVVVTAGMGVAALAMAGGVYVRDLGEARDEALAESQRARLEALHARVSAASASQGPPGVSLRRLSELRDQLIGLEADTLRVDVGIGLISGSSVLPRLVLPVESRSGSALSRDGSRLLIAAGESARLVEVPSGRELARWAATTGLPRPVGSSGIWLFEVTTDGVVGWDPNSGERRRWIGAEPCLAGNAGVYGTVVAASCPTAGKAFLWEWNETSAPAETLECHDCSALSISDVSAGHRTLLAYTNLTSTRTLEVWDGAERLWRGQNEGASALAADGRWLARQTARGFVVIELDGETRHDAPDGQVASFVWLDQDLYVSFVDGRRATYQVLESGLSELQQLRLATPLGGGDSWIADGDTRRLVARPGVVVVYEAEIAGRPLVALGFASGQEFTLSPSGGLMAVANDDGEIWLLDRTTGAELVSWQSEDGSSIRSMDFLDETRLATGHWDGAVRIWALPSARLLSEFRPGDPKVTALEALAPDRLVVGGSSGQVALWQPSTGERLVAYESAVNYPWDIEANFDGSRVLVSDRQPKNPGRAPHAQVFDSITGAEKGRFVFDEYNGYEVAWSPDGARVLLARQGHVAIVGTPEGEILAELGGHTNSFAVAWSPDGGLAATSDYTGLVRLWATDTWAPLASVSVDGSVITVLSFDPEGQTLLAMTGAGSIREVDFGARAADFKAADRPRSESLDDREIWRRTWRRAAASYDWEEAAEALEQAIDAGLVVEPLELARYRLAVGDRAGALEALQAADPSDPLVALWLEALAD